MDLPSENPLDDTSVAARNVLLGVAHVNAENEASSRLVASS
jgi:hypothetical protein